MEDEYDAIVLGTGLKECILSGLLSTTGYKARGRAASCAALAAAAPLPPPACLLPLNSRRRQHARPPAQVLHMDRNDYYGGEAASLNLNQARARARRERAEGRRRRLHRHLPPLLLHPPCTHTPKQPAAAAAAPPTSMLTPSKPAAPAASPNPSQTQKQRQ